jgi:hypothetical protein
VAYFGQYPTLGIGPFLVQVSYLDRSRFQLCPKVISTGGWPMSERAAYLRDEAEKCRWHADNVTDLQTKAELRRLAVEYIERAALVEIESKE